MPHILTVTSGKGGVGKTTVTAEVGARLAADGYRTLVVDLDPQHNLTTMLGTAPAPEVVAPGIPTLFAALQGYSPAPVVQNVRPNLDLVAGDRQLGTWSRLCSGMPAEVARTALARVLAPIAGEYELILIDCPPTNEDVNLLALCCSDFVISPIGASQTSYNGLEILSSLIDSARTINPHLQFLGAVLFDVSRPSSTRKQGKMWLDVRDDVTPLIGDDSLFEAVVYSSDRAALEATRRGVLITEYPTLVPDDAAKLRAMKQRQAGNLSPEFDGRAAGKDTAERAAGDFEALKNELVARLEAVLAGAV